MEIFLDVWAEDTLSGEKTKCNEAIYTFVAVSKLGKPVKVPTVKPETEIEQERFDGVILVISPEASRIQRVENRDGITEEAIRKRMMHQWTDEQKQPLTDMLIHNNSIDETADQVRKLHLQLMRA